MTSYSCDMCGSPLDSIQLKMRLTRTDTIGSTSRERSQDSDLCELCLNRLLNVIRGREWNEKTYVPLIPFGSEETHDLN